MQIESLYINKIESKTGQIIPLTKNNRTIESKYNPLRDAQNLISTIEEHYKFFILLGIGSGLFLSELIKKFPESKIIAVENTKEDIEFIKELQYIKSLSSYNNILFTNINSLKQTIINSYIPALYGTLKIIEILPWINENSNYLPFIKSEINEALSLISADFSVQAHFGKIWQHNILNNIKHLNHSIKVSTSKTKCAVIAAGPTLDSQIDYLKENIDSLFIITTDTSYSSLLKYNIIPEIVISIDGQFISHSHFIQNIINKKTIFAFDLCSDSSAVNHIPENQILFFTSGHPLSSLVNSFTSTSLLNLYSGAGTVTITAVDLAKKLGFSEIQIIGADFSYNNGKPYTKGTYLDTIYRTNENKLNTAEHLFSKLQYRTELITVSDNIKTTKVLESYKKSLFDYISENKFSYTLKNNIYYLFNNESHNNILNYNYAFNTNEFFKFVQNQIKINNITFLLPYIAYLRSQNDSQSFENMLNLALSVFVSYNKEYEKK